MTKEEYEKLTKEYQEKLNNLMQDALEAEEHFTLDELEEYAKQQRKLN